MIDRNQVPGGTALAATCANCLSVSLKGQEVVPKPAGHNLQLVTRTAEQPETPVSIAGNV